MKDNTFPRFILDKPIGEDVFEGQSQTHLAKSICSYIESNDSGTTNMPRIIGLEGSWGTGKSNIVKKIEDNLRPKGYYTFIYDAWGHQEDLQRRSILETLTNQLLEENVLKGNVDIKMRNGKINHAEWKDQLSLLLSNKTKVITKSQPRLSGAAMWGILLVGLFAVINTFLSMYPDTTLSLCVRVWLQLVPIILGLGVIAYHRCKDKNWNKLATLLTQKNDETIDEQFTSSEEPSIMEFKNWIHAISNHLEKSSENEVRKIIIVFDNMDRLPSEKVMKLWSAIYTFFAGADFKNIWTIIPYDYKHLCNAVNEEGNEHDMHNGEIDKEANDRVDKDKFKRFIDKTFPVVYTVPQPVITDYSKLFNKYFEDAFGKGREHDQRHICQVFMCVHLNPNPRTVIAFINELVAMRLQWPEDKYRLQNIALFILKKDYLLYNGVSLDRNLLSDDLFAGVAAFYPSKEEIRKQMCQFAYGLRDESLAGELPLRRLLSEAITMGNPLVDYVGKPHFIFVLEDILSKEVSFQTLDNAVMSLSSLDTQKMAGEEKDAIRKKWDMLANWKSSVLYDKMQFDDSLAIIIKHASEFRVKNMCASYIVAIQNCTVGKGSDYYDILDRLEKCLLESGKNIKLQDVIKAYSLEPKHFIEFVNVAGSDYKKYQVSAENDKLNEYLFSVIEVEKEGIDMFLELVYKDPAYDFSKLKTNVSNLVASNNVSKAPRLSAFINRLLSQESGMVNARFSQHFIVQNFQNMSTLPIESKLQNGFEDLYAMYLANGNDVPNIEKELIPRIAGCFEKYMDYTFLIQHPGSPDTAFRQLNIYAVKNHLGARLDVKYVVKNIETIKSNLGLSYSELFFQFNRFSVDWNSNDESRFQDYCRQGLFEEYKNSPGQLTNSIIALGVSAMKNKSKGFLYVTSQNPNEYWRKFILSYLGTEYLPEFTDNLYDEFKTLLDRVLAANRVEFVELMDKLLKAEKNMDNLVMYLHEKLNSYFKHNRCQIAVFKVFGALLPYLGPDMDENTARGLISNFIDPVVIDRDCAAIIVDNASFYFGVMEHNKVLSMPILKKMLSNANVSEIYLSVKKEIELLMMTVEE